MALDENHGSVNPGQSSQEWREASSSTSSAQTTADQMLQIEALQEESSDTKSTNNTKA